MFIFSYLSVAFDLLGNVPYLFQIAKGQIRTHPFTWLIWTILTFIMAVVQVNEGAGGGSWLLINTTIFNTLITIFAFRGGMKGIDKIDYLVLLICLGCFPLYFYFKQPLLTALVITLVDSASFIPMIRKLFRDPTGESASFQILLTAAYICSLLAMETYTLPTCLFPAAMVMMHALTGTSILLLRKKTKV